MADASLGITSGQTLAFSFQKEWKKRVHEIYGWTAARFEGTAPKDAFPYPTDPELRRTKRVTRRAYNIAFSFLLGGLLVWPGPRFSEIPSLKVGEIADRDYITPHAFEIENADVSEETKAAIAKKIAPVFDYDDSALPLWVQTWEQAFQKIRNEFYLPKNGVKPKFPPLEVLGQKIQEYTGQILQPRDLLFLHQARFSPVIERIFVDLTKPLINRWISGTELFPAYFGTGILVRSQLPTSNDVLVSDVSKIWSLAQVRDVLVQASLAMPSGKSELVQRTVHIMSTVLISNLKLNQEKTQKRIDSAIAKSKSSTTIVRRGQLVVRRGDRITESQNDLLAKIHQYYSWKAIAKRWVLAFLFYWIFLSILMRLELSRKSLWKLSLKDSVAFLSITVASLFLERVSLPYFRVFLQAFDLRAGAEYLLPLSTGGMLLHLMLGREAAMSYALILAMSIGVALEGDLSFAIYAFCLIFSSVQIIRSCKQRTDLYKAGIWSGVIGGSIACLATVAQGLATLEPGFEAVALGNAILAVIAGLLSSVICGALIPIIESLFGYTTSLKLLELSNFNHPLLHDLMLKAPGTYHHSIIVGSLAEIAADRIKANPLLARVSAYYHDIGKMTKPLYFIENQAPNQNPHDELSPNMSAKILFSHVKNGVRLGKQFNLGDLINHIIEQHHGTTLVSFFYNKAKSLTPDGQGEVLEGEFRYPGPLPQTREAAIVMIADACEAATRSISEPTPTKIHAMVKNIINKRFLDEQFKECDLTFHDLQVIEDCFTRTLVSLYHHRIEYPGQKQELKGVRESEEKWLKRLHGHQK